MATLAEQRRAIAAGVAAGRQATGEAERKAIGQRIIEERTGKAVVDDVIALIRPERQRRQQRTVQPVGAVPAGQGRGVYKAPPSTATGGLSSPLTETGTREYHPVTILTSSDGIFTLQVEHVKKLFMTDANSVEHEFNYLDPEA